MEILKFLNSCYRSCGHGQSLLCLQLRADEAYGSVQWKMTLQPRFCVKTADNCDKSYCFDKVSKENEDDEFRIDPFLSSTRSWPAGQLISSFHNSFLLRFSRLRRLTLPCPVVDSPEFESSEELFHSSTFSYHSLFSTVHINDSSAGTFWNYVLSFPFS